MLQFSHFFLLLTTCLVLALPADLLASRSTKKGACLSLKKNPDWAEKAEALKVSWLYTWGYSLKSSAPSNVEFVPMIWSQWSCNEKVMEELSESAHPALLGFNEPDEKRQANLTVAKAIELWPLLMSTDLPLGSPAAVHPDGDWMREFMKEADARSYRVDFIAMHAYPGKDPQKFLDRLDRIYALYGRPIWITEFAVGDWQASQQKPNRHSVEEISEFMRVVIPELESRDYVERYAWYSSEPQNPHLGTSTLFYKDGTLTKLGQLYSTF